MMFHVSLRFMASFGFKWRANFQSQEPCQRSPKDRTGSRARHVVTFMCTSWRAQNQRHSVVHVVHVVHVVRQCRVLKPLVLPLKHVRNMLKHMQTACSQVSKLSRFTRISAVHSVARLIFRISGVILHGESRLPIHISFVKCNECSVNRAVDLTKKVKKNASYGQHISKLLKYTMLLDLWFLKMSAAKLQGLSFCSV